MDGTKPRRRGWGTQFRPIGADPFERMGIRVGEMSLARWSEVGGAQSGTCGASLFGPGLWFALICWPLASWGRSRCWSAEADVVAQRLSVQDFALWRSRTRRGLCCSPGSSWPGSGHSLVRKIPESPGGGRLALSLPRGLGGGGGGVTRGVLNGEKKETKSVLVSQKSPRALHVLNHGWWQLAVGGWRRLAVGGWQLATGGWWRLVVVGGGWWLAVGGWRQLAVVGSWRLVAAGGWRRLAAVGGWRLVAVGS